MLVRNAIVSLVCVLCAWPATAQTDFSGLKLKVGQMTYVTDSDGTQVSGRLTALSPSMLSIDGHEFRPVPGLKIQRRGDSLWNGAAWGLGVGLILGMLSSSGECGVQWSSGRCIASGGMWGAAIGTGIDLAHVGRTTVRIFRPATRGRAVTARGNDPAAQ